MANNENLLGCEEQHPTVHPMAESTDEPGKGFLRTIDARGIKHPAKVQHECIKIAGLGMPLCQAKLGFVKTVEFVRKMLQQLEQIESVPYALVLTPSSERVFQLRIEYERSNMCMPTIKVAAVCDGSPIDKDDEVLETITSHIIVGTPNRVLGLIRNNKLDLKNIKHFVLDDCNKMLKQLDVLGKVHDILRNTPYGKHSIIFPDSRHIGVRPVYERIKSTITSLNTISTTFPTTTAPITPDAAPQIVNNSSKCCCIDMNCFSITQSCVRNWTCIIGTFMLVVLMIVFCLVLVVVCFRYLFEQTTTK